jgi:hypothetical protein
MQSVRRMTADSIAITAFAQLGRCSTGSEAGGQSGQGSGSGHSVAAHFSQAWHRGQ